jgi:hypothetical protein
LRLGAANEAGEIARHLLNDDQEAQSGEWKQVVEAPEAALLS